MTKSDRRDPTTAICITCNSAASSSNSFPQLFATFMAADKSLFAEDGVVIDLTADESSLRALAECKLICPHVVRTFKHSSGLASGYYILSGNKRLSINKLGSIVFWLWTAGISNYLRFCQDDDIGSKSLHFRSTLATKTTKFLVLTPWVAEAEFAVHRFPLGYCALRCLQLYLLLVEYILPCKCAIGAPVFNLYKVHILLSERSLPKSPLSPWSWGRSCTREGNPCPPDSRF